MYTYVLRLTQLRNILLLFCYSGITITYHIIVSDGVHNLFCECTVNTNVMYCTNIITHSPAHYFNQYKTLKSKVLKCCANIYFSLHGYTVLHQ